LTRDHTILAQVVKLVSRAQIEALDHEYGTPRPSRVLSRWSRFGALVFAQRSGRHRLRDGVSDLASQAHALTPRGLIPPKHSTLAEANERRPAALYQALFATLYVRCRAVAPRHRVHFKSPLYSLDSTTISLCLSLFPWARFRTAKGAIKLPTLLDHAGPLPAFVVLTEGKRSDMAVARGLQLPKGSITAMDRGDIAYRVLFRLTQDRDFFVTRQKVNARFKVAARFAADWQRGLTSDHNVVLLGQKAHA
jgi:Domain of unknown function (DUF4372)